MAIILRKIKRRLVKSWIYQVLLSKLWEFRHIYEFPVCAWRYRRLLRQVKRKPKSEKIRVLFIVSEIAKWKEQRLYEEMERSGVFEPIVGISAWNRQLEHLCSNEELQKVHSRAEKFFDHLGDRHVRTVLVENGKRVFLDLASFRPDIVFYTEQWAPCPRQNPYDVSKYALTCFLPYYVPDFGFPKFDCYQLVERLSWKYFCLGESWVNRYQESLRFKLHLDNFQITGHPALDYLVQNRTRPPKENYVIYAPHFSFMPVGRDLDYVIGTFGWSGLAILEYAERHQEINWIFKPHPILRNKIVEYGFMTESEVDSYYNRWGAVAKLSTDGDYQELFIQSRALITDSGSFLPEYGATGRPVIRLISEHDRTFPPFAAKNLYDSYYQAHDVDELQKILKLVVEDGLDPRSEMRLAAVKAAGLLEPNASRKITDYLQNVLGR